MSAVTNLEIRSGTSLLTVPFLLNHVSQNANWLKERSVPQSHQLLPVGHAGTNPVFFLFANPNDGRPVKVTNRQNPFPRTRAVHRVSFQFGGRVFLCVGIVQLDLHFFSFGRTDNRINDMDQECDDNQQKDNDQQVSLHEGQVKLVVPPQGVGFVVDTAQRKFVDLGTSFVVTAGAQGSEVLVLDGQISVDDHDGSSAELMHEGEFARFDRDGKTEKRKPNRLSQALPELSLAATHPGDDSLRGVVLGYDSSATITKNSPSEDVIVRELLRLIRSGLNDGSNIEAFK